MCTSLNLQLAHKPDVWYIYKLRDTDPILELLAVQNLVTLRGRGKYAVSAYYISPLHGLLGIKVGDKIAHMHLVNIYRWLALNPYTLIGDFNLAVITEKTFKPGPGLFPTALNAEVITEPSNPYGVYYPAIAATMLRASRRGLDLIRAFIQTAVITYGLLARFARREFEKCKIKLKATINALIQALLYKNFMLTKLGEQSLRRTTLAVTEFISLRNVESLIKKYIKYKDIRKLDALEYIIQDKELITYIFGRWFKDIYVYSLESLGAELINAIDNLSKKLSGDYEAVIMEVTGQFSLADLYLLYRAFGSSKIYLALTPETLINMLHIHLWIKDLSHELNYELKSNKKEFIINTAFMRVKHIPLLVSATDPHVAEHIYSEIAKKHKMKIIYLVAHPPTSSARAIKRLLTLGLPRDNIRPYAKLLYF